MWAGMIDIHSLSWGRVKRFFAYGPEDIFSEIIADAKSISFPDKTREEADHFHKSSKEVFSPPLTIPSEEGPTNMFDPGEIGATIGPQPEVLYPDNYTESGDEYAFYSIYEETTEGGDSPLNPDNSNSFGGDDCIYLLRSSAGSSCLSNGDCTQTEACLRIARELVVLIYAFQSMRQSDMPRLGTLLSYFHFTTGSNFFVPGGSSNTKSHLHTLLGQLSNSVLGETSAQNLSIVDIALLMQFPSVEVVRQLSHDGYQDFENLYEQELKARYTFGNYDFAVDTECNLGPFEMNGLATYYGTDWAKYITLTTPSRPCVNYSEPLAEDNYFDWMRSNDCCALLKPLFARDNIRGLLQIAKLSGVFPTPTKTNFTENFFAPAEFIRKRYSVPQPPTSRPITRSYVPLCGYGSSRMVPCRRFFTYPSPRGACFSYNRQPVEKLHASSPFVTDFVNAFGSRSELSDAGLESSDSSESRIVLLDGHEFSRSVMSPGSGEGPSGNNFFTLSIHSPNSFADNSLAPIKLQPGMKTSIRIDTVQLKSSKELYSVSLSARKCKFPDETSGLSLFKIYTQSNCWTECLVRNVAGFCGCTPWSFPVLENGPRICDYFGNACFKFRAKGFNYTRLCDCPFDCEGERYSVNVMQTKLDPDTICKKGASIGPFKNYMFRNMQRGSRGNSSERFLLQVASLKAGGTSYLLDPEGYEEEYCKRRLESDLAEVQVFMASPTITRLRQSKKVTIAAQLSTLGKQLGKRKKENLPK